MKKIQLETDALGTEGNIKYFHYNDYYKDSIRLVILYKVPTHNYQSGRFVWKRRSYWEGRARNALPGAKGLGGGNDGVGGGTTEGTTATDLREI